MVCRSHGPAAARAADGDRHRHGEVVEDDFCAARRVLPEHAAARSLAAAADQRTVVTVDECGQNPQVLQLATALARWTHPVRGPIAPDVFISVAEEAGLINRLGDRILDIACRAAARWTSVLPAFWLSENRSVRQIDDPDLLPRMALQPCGRWSGV